MERQPFQVKMNPKHHRILKLRAKQLGMSIAELVENLISHQEQRLKKAYKVLGIDREKIEDVLLKDELLLRILLKDEGSINEKWLKAEWEKTKTAIGTTTVDFEPTITA